MEESTPRFIGCDVHKRQVTICVLGEDGRVSGRHRIACTREALVRFAERHLEPDDQLALEATTNTWAVVDLLEPFVDRLVVSNPLRTRAIAAAKIKTDHIDARVLAELLRAGYLPEVWQPDAATRRLRELTHRRAGLVANRTALKNRIHSILAMRLIPIPWAKPFTGKGLAWLTELELDPDARQALDSDLRLLATLEAEIRQLEDRLAQLAYAEQSVRLLMTLPGADFTVGQAMVAAWGPIERFPDADHAASYLGLASSTHQSDRVVSPRPTPSRQEASASAMAAPGGRKTSRPPRGVGRRASQRRRPAQTVRSWGRVAVPGSARARRVASRR